jgi:hypothetical protein
MRQYLGPSSAAPVRCASLLPHFFVAAPCVRPFAGHRRLWYPCGALIAVLSSAWAAEPIRADAAAWQVGAPIVTYWAGPTLTEAVATQITEGGFNLVWCGEAQLDVARRHGLRAMLTDGLLAPASLDQPAQRTKLDALLERVRKHPALYAYFITDEPSAPQFAALGRLVAYLRERDPGRVAYINLFPTYANNQQLGTKGDTVAAYQDHLCQYTNQVKPALISYDHYQYMVSGETDQYFLNLAMIRRLALDGGVPFLNIVQACSWAPNVRVPNTNEIRYLVFTTAAYGAQGLSYYVYCCAGHTGAMALPDGTPTAIYQAVKTYNREFAALAKELQPLRSLAVYHTSLRQRGCEPLPANALFRIEPSNPSANPRGFLLGTFGRTEKPTHAVVVNLDGKEGVKATLLGPGPLEVFEPATAQWTKGGEGQTGLTFLPGGGHLVRLRGL